MNVTVAMHGMDRRERTRAQAHDASAARAGLRIVVADHDPEARRLAALVLRRDGHDVHEAGDGDALLALLRARQRDQQPAFELIITDAWRGGRATEQVLLEVLRAAGGSGVAVTTDFGDAVTERYARKLGAVAVLQKPFELDELRALAARGLGRSLASAR